MPPASRMTSTTATPKINKGKAVQSPLIIHDVEETRLNGAPSTDADHSGPQFSDDALFSVSVTHPVYLGSHTEHPQDGSPPRKIPRDKTKMKTKRREVRREVFRTKPSLMMLQGKVIVRRKKRSSSWLDLFSRMFILAFLVYSLSVCPTADKQKTPVCRALSEYRRLVLEPYVITPVQNLLHHPSVSPYTTTIIEKAQPVMARSKQEWYSRVVPAWNAHVVPQWEKHAVPAWNKHVSPQLARLSTKVDPYIQRATDLYNTHATPYVRQTQVLAYKAQPYVLLAGAKTYDAYQSSKPYFARLFKELERVPPIIVNHIINPLASARRQYVDPHVELLLEKIQELSSGATKANSDVVESPVITSAASKQVEGSDKAVEVELPSVSEVKNRENDTLSSAASVVSASLSLSTGHTNPSSTFIPSRSTETGDKSAAVESASSTMSASAFLGDVTESVPGATYSPAPEPDVLQDQSEPGAETSTGDVVTSSSVLEMAEEPTPSVEVPKAHRPPVSPSGSSSKDDDLDDLLAELGLDLEETVSTDAPPEPSVVEESEEEKAAREVARLAEVAAKRRELEGRHSRWEEKLSEMIETQKVALKEAIASIRRTGAAELKINLSIRAGIETLNSEAEKALRGTDAYFTKLRTGGKPVAEQARLWDRVLEKVQAKFDERVQDVEELVNNWYEQEVLSKEREEVREHSHATCSV